MSRLEAAFDRLEGKGEGALISYLMAGDPDPETCLSYVRALLAGGTDVLELGLPYSDPLADGPTIQEAARRAFRSGAGFQTGFEIVEKTRRESSVPIVLMTYYNPIYRLGEENFFAKCAHCGVDGVIIADLPVGEAGGVLTSARKHALDVIFLATPNTGPERLRRIVKASTGFLYLAARYGTTGARNELASYTQESIANIAPSISGELPLSVGFGLSSRSHVEEVIAAGADGAIVGSALVDKIGRGVDIDDFREFTQSLKDGTRVKPSSS